MLCRSSHRDLAAVVAKLGEELRRCQREKEKLRRENEILREGAEPLIRTRRARFGVKLMCTVLVADGANYRAWVRGRHKRRDREHDERRLLRLIVEVRTAQPAYGAERVTRALKRQGIEVGRHRVARLMHENGIAGITCRRRRNLTKTNAGAAAVRV